MDEILKQIKKLRIKYTKDESLKKLTSYKTGGKVFLVVYPKNVNELIEVLKLTKEANIKTKVLGNGTNILFSDNDYNGIIIKLSEFNKITYFNKYMVKAEAGVNLIKLALDVSNRHLAGLEFASGIPGTVGGAVFMNAGAYNSDMGYVVRRIKVLTPDLKIITMTNKELGFHYRTSFLQKNPEYICLEATLKLYKGEKEALFSVINDRKRRRMESQPLEYPSAGSVFRNPEGLSAGKLIDDLGLKGKTINGAMISTKHANFIINYDKAKSSDIKALIDLVKKEVLNKYNINLKCEQEMVNFDEEKNKD